jgi:hypothetical protein
MGRAQRGNKASPARLFLPLRVLVCCVGYGTNVPVGVRHKRPRRQHSLLVKTAGMRSANENGEPSKIFCGTVIDKKRERGCRSLFSYFIFSPFLYSLCVLRLYCTTICADGVDE